MPCFWGPGIQVLPIQTRTAHRQDIDNVIKVLAALPAEFLNDNVFRGANPGFAANFTHKVPATAAKAFAVVLVLDIQTKNLDLEVGWQVRDHIADGIRESF
ncbi:MAG: hypothetical protein IAF94_20860 [Pirellulaceae bacterium]|nr:hypothetical protein [Pirellulaceae bacterium]